MAALGHGPLHVGRSVPMEGEENFDSVFIVHYPSVKYFAELLCSQYFPSIVNNKQLVDIMAVPTVPITEQVL
ncbi:MAG: hypothetical protein ACI9JM_001909 [Halioglobus sp.]|jgi:hypothetical protein